MISSRLSVSLNSTFKLLSRAHSNVGEHQKNLMARGLPKQRELTGVQKIICVASGKGGVGKSTVAVNIATTLANRFGLKVGLLDADIYGPSIPKMMNLVGHEPEVIGKDLMLPVQNYGVACMSMGFLVDEESPIVWRGLMVMSAIQRLMFQVKWAPLDYLVIDMPPGTGDVQLSISQNLKVHGSVIVSTPQDIALLDTRRGIEMFNKVNVKNLGIVQNMSHYLCEKCGNIDYIFGKEGARKLAEHTGVPILGDLPINRRIREHSDSGTPITVSEPEHRISQVYFSIVEKIIKSLS